MTHQTNHARRRSFLAWSAAVAVSGSGWGPALAQGASFPNRPLRFLVPYPPGGGNDYFARAVGQKLSENLGQPVIVDNRPGAAGLIAGDALAKAPPDGYTIMVDQSSIATNMLTYKKMPFDARKDIAPLMLGATLDNAVLVNAQSPIRSIADLVAMGKTPDRLAYASTGTGSSQHLAIELMCAQAGIRLLHVPYKGTAAAMTALSAGEVQLFVISVPTAQGYVKSGRVRVIASTGSRRSPVLPDIPTVAESGLPEFVNTNWLGVFTTAGTPMPLQDRLSQELIKAVRDPGVSDSLTRQGWSVDAAPATALRSVFDQETARYAQVVRAGNIQID